MIGAGGYGAGGSGVGEGDDSGFFEEAFAFF
jgi:hypothetical protein